MIPSVRAIAACLGFLPVANAFGVIVGIIYGFGIGILALLATERINSFMDSSFSGFALYIAKTILSEKKYVMILKTIAMNRATVRPL